MDTMAHKKKDDQDTGSKTGYMGKYFRYDELVEEQAKKSDQKDRTSGKSSKKRTKKKK